MNWSVNGTVPVLFWLLVKQRKLPKLATKTGVNCGLGWSLDCPGKLGARYGRHGAVPTVTFFSFWSEHLSSLTSSSIRQRLFPICLPVSSTSIRAIVPVSPQDPNGSTLPFIGPMVFVLAVHQSEPSVRGMSIRGIVVGGIVVRESSLG